MVVKRGGIAGLLVYYDRSSADKNQNYCGGEEVPAVAREDIFMLAIFRSDHRSVQLW